MFSAVDQVSSGILVYCSQPGATVWFPVCRYHPLRPPNIPANGCYCHCYCLSQYCHPRSHWLLAPLLILYLPILPPQEPLASAKLLLPLLLLLPVLAFSCLLLSWSIFDWCGSLLPPSQGVPIPECFCTKTNASALFSFLFLEWTTDIFNNNLWWEYWRPLTSIFHPSERQIALNSPCWLVGQLVSRSASQLIFQQQWSSGWIGLLQMIIWIDRPLANDHPEQLASCKWSYGLISLLQMIDRIEWSLANDHLDGSFS